MKNLKNLKLALKTHGEWSVYYVERLDSKRYLNVFENKSTHVSLQGQSPECSQRAAADALPSPSDMPENQAQGILCIGKSESHYWELLPF